MCRSMMYFLCLIAALSGTPLRQAEAADDLARTVGKIGQGHIIESIDGGVGDDAEASILRPGGVFRSIPATFLLAMATIHFAPPVPGDPPLGSGDRRPPGRSGSLLAGTTRRFAWLQRFRF